LSINIKISELKEIFEKIEEKDIDKRELILEIENTCDIYEEDEKAGIKNLIKKYRKVADDIRNEYNRIYKISEFERKYSEYEYICGIDEVGRGPLAGPVVAAAVILPKDCEILYINDSKKLSSKKREELFLEIKEKAIAIGIGMESPKVIDEVNILNATYLSMKKAIESLSVKPDILLNDAVTIPGVLIKQIPIIKGDAKSVSIAAASIIAKVTRDKMMEEFDKIYPGYDFASNKGYGSQKHIEALAEIGKTPIHRESFIKNFI
jgi:ribonuclease HII